MGGLLRLTGNNGDLLKMPRTAGRQKRDGDDTKQGKKFD